MAPRNGPRSREAGQATVELALALPMLCLLLLGAVQIVEVGIDQLIATEVARTGARAAAVSADPTNASAAAVRQVVGHGARVLTTIHNGYVTVTVVITNATDVALIGVLIPDVDLTGRATMILEPP